MRTGSSEVVPGDLAEARSRFQAWRNRRKRAAAFPRDLWALAAKLATRYGISRTATVLGLDYYGLKKRVEEAGDQPQSSRPSFVELPLPVDRQAVSVRAGQRRRGHPARATGRLRRGRPRGPRRAASGTPADAADHAADEDPGRRRAGRFSPRHRWAGAALPGNPPARSVRRHGLRLPQSPGDGAEGAHVRWPGILALPQAAFPGPLSLVARGRGRTAAQRLAAHQLSVLLAAGNPTRTGAAADWRPVGPLA